MNPQVKRIQADFEVIGRNTEDITERASAILKALHDGEWEFNIKAAPHLSSLSGDVITWKCDVWATLTV